MHRPEPRFNPEYQAFARAAREWTEQAIHGAHGASGVTLDHALATGFARHEPPQQAAIAWTLVCLADPTFPGSERMQEAIVAERARQSQRLAE